jgi:hypothetical protein
MKALETGWLVFATLGEMKITDVIRECQPGSWAPVLVFRDGDKTVVPILATQDHAIRFAQRNLPKGQVFGTVVLTSEDVEKISKEFTAKGFTFVELSHPKKMASKADVEVYEFVSAPDVYGIKSDSSSVALSYDMASPVKEP